ncbi:unnamed protein product [Lupinus luteus]|uniref:Uncharacterized protein n=1 Tax=Lupinus luteus TaxID=3873 RepID=A0AAV1YAH5_LUPLU
MISSVCDNWTGVTCNKNKSRVKAIRLPGFEFHGTIPPNTINNLTSLQNLSLRSNVICGNFPSDFTNLRNLSFLYLQFNNLSGPLPDISGWKNLTIFNLSNNNFNSSLPLSLWNLTQLANLNLLNNSLSGEIPDLKLPRLQLLNLSNSHLQGGVLKSLMRRTRDEDDNAFGGKLQKGGMSPEKVVSWNQDENNKLTFFEWCNYAFDLEDLLTASVEVLRKGTFGKRREDRVTLDWDIRLRIGLGTAKGIAHIHVENGAVDHRLIKSPKPWHQCEKGIQGFSSICASLIMCRISLSLLAVSKHEHRYSCEVHSSKVSNVG